MENRVEELRRLRGLNQEAFAISDFFGQPIEEIFLHRKGDTV